MENLGETQDLIQALIEGIKSHQENGFHFMTVDAEDVPTDINAFVEICQKMNCRVEPVSHSPDYISSYKIVWCDEC